MDRRKRIRRICLFVILAGLCLTALYFTLDMPCFSPEMAMHRMEAMHWVGPSRLIAEDTREDDSWDRIMLGETDYGYCLYEYSTSLGWDHGNLTYVEKTGGTVFFCPDRYLNIDFDDVLPVFVIPEQSGAVSAVLTLQTESSRDPAYCGQYSTRSQLRQGQYFLFAVDITDMNIDVRRFWDQRLHGDDMSYAYISGIATLELFDLDGNLLETVVTEYPSNS